MSDDQERSSQSRTEEKYKVSGQLVAVIQTERQVLAGNTAMAVVPDQTLGDITSQKTCATQHFDFNL